MSNKLPVLSVQKSYALTNSQFYEPSVTTPFFWSSTISKEPANFLLASPTASSNVVEIVELRKKIERLQNLPSPSTLPVEVSKKAVEKGLEERLFDATSDIKMLTSTVTMHMDREWRDRLFSQLDRLHDAEEFDEADVPISKDSFKTFLKVMVAMKPAKRPGLGLGNNGCLLAAWVDGSDRMTLEFMPKDKVKWVISTTIDDEIDLVSGQTVASRLLDALRQNDMGGRFGAQTRSTT